jgi:hypothetical protein
LPQTGKKAGRWFPFKKVGLFWIISHLFNSDTNFTAQKKQTFQIVQ